MEKAISGDLIKVLLAVFAVSIGVFIFLIALTKRIIGSSRSIRRKQNIYLIVGGIFIGLTGFAAHPSVLNPDDPDNPQLFIILFQAYFLILGILHYYLMVKLFPIDDNRKAFGLKFVFTLTLSLLGFLIFILVFRYFNRSGYQYLMAASILCLIIPLLVYEVYLRAVLIPPKKIKIWRYPVHQKFQEPDHSVLKNMFIISFRMQKKVTDPFNTNFRAKAPSEMEFGKLFYYFINDYNERNPDDKIEFLNESGTPQEWTFYKKPKWYRLFTYYLDADKTVSTNHLKENDIIICYRS